MQQKVPRKTSSGPRELAIHLLFSGVLGLPRVLRGRIPGSLEIPMSVSPKAVPTTLNLPAADRTSTGIDGLDYILGGGFPRNRIYLIEGHPGSGKTTLGLQFLLEGRERGKPACAFLFPRTGKNCTWLPTRMDSPSKASSSVNSKTSKISSSSSRKRNTRFFIRARWN
jgi:hypothetical protein